MLLEVCAFNIRSCFIAEQAGAHRIEFCADPVQGGTTPSYGMLTYAIEHITIPIFPMIRPRGGNFMYDRHELEVMSKDIFLCRQLGYKGIATGVQLEDGRIDTETLKRIVEWAGDMAVTCHKVFDRAPDAFEALEAVISTGCKRILTSGLHATATEGATTLAQLVQEAAGRIVIMPGGGVRSSNIAQLIAVTGAVEYHSSGLVTKDGAYNADETEIMALVNELNN